MLLIMSPPIALLRDHCNTFDKLIQFGVITPGMATIHAYGEKM